MDLKDVLTEGFADLEAYRTDVIFLCVIYPVVGLVLARLTFGYAMLPLLFPLAAGFALVGPAAAVGLYEMSRRREQGINASWGDAFAVVNSPAFGAIAVLALLLVIIFVVWVVARSWHSNIAIIKSVKSLRNSSGSFATLAAIRVAAADPPLLKWSDFRYVFDSQEGRQWKGIVTRLERFSAG
jgi:hypothetical protein